MRFVLLLLCLPLAATGAEPVRVYLVRHAETGEAVMGVPAPGPSLSATGKRRAQALAAALSTAHIKRIFVSPFARTQETAAPLASRLKLPPSVESQDQASQDRIAKAVLSMPAGSSVLIVGHSNTVPPLIGLLGVTAVPTIKEEEFDKIFLVIISGKHARLETRTYGNGSP